jgi:hypothetical protein
MNKRAGILCIGVLALFSLTSCGGSGGGGGAERSCGTDVYIPNYALDQDADGSDNLLTFWDRLPLKVYYEGDVTIRGGSGVDVSWAAFERWNTISAQTLVTRTTVLSDADVIVRFRIVPATTTVLGVTTKRIVVSTRETVSAEIQLNVWTTMTNDQFFKGFAATSAHEMGHVLYLSGHSESNADLMFPFGSASADKDISTADYNTLLTAYCGVFDTRASRVKAASRAREGVVEQVFETDTSGGCNMHSHAL